MAAASGVRDPMGGSMRLARLTVLVILALLAAPPAAGAQGPDAAGRNAYLGGGE